jgi:hypothetical protein
MAQNRLDPGEFIELVDRRARIAAVKRQAGPAICAEILRGVRIEGRYPQLEARSREKRDYLSQIGADGSNAAPVGDRPHMDDAALLEWYANERLRTPISGDLDRHARSLGYADHMMLLRALRLEWLYRKVAK